MAYRVVYGPERKESKQVNGSGMRISLLTVFFLAVFLIIVNCSWPAGRETLQDIFLPVESRTAFAELVSDIKEGEPLPDAVQAFCQTIIENAELSDEHEIPD